MKRLVLTIALAGLAALGLLAAACSDDDDDAPDTTTPEVTSSPAATGTPSTATATQATATSTASSHDLEDLLTEAILEEYKAHATYQAVIDAFGQVSPFTNIVKSEQSHIDAWVRLFEQNKLSVPADPYLGKVTAPTSIAAACQVGVAAETEDVALYDRLMKLTTDAAFLAVAQSQRTVSQENHLPAFQRCA